MMVVGTDALIGTAAVILVVLIGLMALVYHRLGAVEAKTTGLEAKVESEGKATRAYIQDMVNWMANHKHDADGKAAGLPRTTTRCG